MRQRDFVWLRLLLMLLLLLPLAVLFLMPGTGMVLGTTWFWLALMLCLWMVWMVLGVPRDEREGAAPVIVGPRVLAPGELPPVIREVMDVRLATEHDGVLAFRGPLKGVPTRRTNISSAKPLGRWSRWCRKTSNWGPPLCWCQEASNRQQWSGP